MRRILTLSILLFFLVWARSRGPDGFREECMLRGVRFENPPQTVVREEVQKRLSQRFTFLGAGTQVGALVGEDGETVFKFLLGRSMKGRRHLSWPSRHRSRRMEMRQIEGEKTLCRYAEALPFLREEMGILYTRLDPEADLEGSYLRVVCADGVERAVSLAGVPFWLQRKMEPLPRDPQVGGALFDLLRRRAEKGFTDVRQQAFNGANYGRIGERVYLIDAGRIERREVVIQDPEAELQRMQARVTRWLESS